MNRFLSISVSMGVCVVLILGGVKAAPLPAGHTAGTAWLDQIQLPGKSSRCETAYPEGFFRACYYQGRDPYTGNFLGAEDESPLDTPVPDRAFGIDHDWDKGPVFLGITPGGGNIISAIWRGRLYFKPGRYQFTTFARDGVRLFIDENLLIDEWVPDPFWYRFGTVIELAEGFHDIRVEWFAAGQSSESTLLRLHWDRVSPAPGPAQVSPIVIDVFLLEKQDICIVGDSYVSGDPAVIYNPDGSVYRAWQVDESRGLPRTLPPSDPALHSYPQVECFSFGYLPEEIPHLLTEVEEFADLIRNWSGGDIQPDIRLSQIEGEVNLGRIGTSWWIPPGFIAPFAESSMTTESDFAIVLSSNDDIQTRRFYPTFGCGAAYGVASYTMGGTGYSWVPCVNGLTILHEWEHQFSGAVNHLLGFQSIYPVDDPASYPPCGMGDPDSFKWFPDSEHWGIDPDSPWCGIEDPSKVGIAELHLFAHYDASLSHYPLGFFTGNHCNDGIQDFGESEVDQGGNCPAEAPEKQIEKQPTDDAWVQKGSAGNHGRERQLRVQKDSKVVFLKFDLQEVQGEIVNAALSVRVNQAKKATVDIYAVADIDWQERTLNGKNAPRIGERIDSAVIQNGDERITWDVTSSFASALEQGAKSVSFALILADGEQVTFSSKEDKDGSKAPLLVITSETAGPVSNLRSSR